MLCPRMALPSTWRIVEKNVALFQGGRRSPEDSNQKRFVIPGEDKISTRLVTKHWPKGGGAAALPEPLTFLHF